MNLPQSGSMRIQLLILQLLVATSTASQPQLRIAEVSTSEQVAMIVVSGEPDAQIALESTSSIDGWTPLSTPLVQLDENGYGVTQIALGSGDRLFLRAYENNPLPLLYRQFADRLDVYLDGEYVVIETDDIPDHPSPYFAPGDPRYEAYNGTNPSFRINPNRIEEQTLTFRIPLNPTEAASKQDTRLGPIGVALNGVAFYNQYAGPNLPLTNEIDSFDQYNGHPTGGNAYHYHFEPLFLTANDGKSALLGVLLDGFPVYGPSEDGKTLTTDDLDAYHGHFGPTPEFPDGIYHYHFTGELPYLNGGKYFGIPGTQTN